MWKERVTFHYTSKVPKNFPEADTFERVTRKNKGAHSGPSKF